MHIRLTLFIALFIFSMDLSAQSTEYLDWKIVNTEIIYQKVFAADSITAEKLAEFLKTAPNISNVEIKNGAVTADMSDLMVDYKKFQFTQVATPPIIQTGKFSGKVTGDAKDGKYRVTVKSIQVKGNMGYKNIPELESMTNYACINSGTVLSRDWCKPTMLGLLDKAFTDRFTYISANKDGEW